MAMVTSLIANSADVYLQSLSALAAQNTEAVRA
jgi:hypothetical protein